MSEVYGKDEKKQESGHRLGVLMLKGGRRRGDGKSKKNLDSKIKGE